MSISKRFMFIDMCPMSIHLVVTANILVEKDQIATVLIETAAIYIKITAIAY